MSILLLFALWHIQFVKTSYLISDFMPKDSTVLKTDKDVRSKFNLVDRSPVLALLELPSNIAGNWTSTTALQYLTIASEEIAQWPGVKEVVSLATVKVPVNNNQALDFINLAREQNPQQLQAAATHPLINPFLLSKSQRTTAIAIETENLSSEQIKNLIVRIENFLRAKIPFAKIEMGGAPAVQTQLNQNLRNELSSMALISIFVFVFLIFALFNSLTLALFTGGLILLANIVVFGLLSYAHVSVSILLSCLPCLIAIDVVALVVQTFQRWKDKNPQHMHQRQRLKKGRELIAELLIPNALGSLTTCLGFLCLAFDSVPVISQFALATTFSILISTTLTQWMMFQFIGFISPPKRSWRSSWRSAGLSSGRNSGRHPWNSTGGIKFPPAILKHSRAIVMVCVLLACYGVLQIPQLKFGGKLFDDLSSSSSSRRATDIADHSLGGLVNVDYDLSASPGYWSDPARQLALRDLCEKLRKSASTTCLSSYDLIRDFSMSTKATVRESAFLYSLSTPNLMSQFLTSDFASARIMVKTHDLPTLKLQRLQRSFERELHKVFPEVVVRKSGMGFTTHYLNQELAKSLVFGFWQSLLLIGVILIFIYRSLRWALVACLPNLIPPIFLIAIMGQMDTNIKPGLAMVFSISLGMAFTNTIYLLNTIGALGKVQGLHRGLVRMAFQKEWYPCFLSSLLVMAGFAVFLTSKFQVNQEFGLYIMLALAFGLVGDLVFLPALIRLFPQLLGLARTSPTASQNQSRSLTISASGSASGTASPTSSRSRNHTSTQNLTILESPDDTKKEPPMIAPPKPLILPMNKKLTRGPYDKIGGHLAIIGMGLLGILCSSTMSPVALAMPSARTAATASPTAQQVLQKTRTLVDKPNDHLLISLQTRERNGKIEKRKVEIWSLRNSDTQFLKAKIMEPLDVKGMTYLAHIHKESDEQWLYMPASQQTRKISSNGVGDSGILGSEISAQELNSEALRSSRVKMLKQTSSEWWIQIVPERSKSDYTQAILVVDRKTNLPTKATYYKKQAAIKTVLFQKYKKWDHSTYRAERIVVHNLQSKRTTSALVQPQSRQPASDRGGPGRLTESVFSVAGLGN